VTSFTTKEGDKHVIWAVFSKAMVHRCTPDEKGAWQYAVRWGRFRPAVFVPPWFAPAAERQFDTVSAEFPQALDGYQLPPK
jgi:hypothetical protein